VSGHPPQPRRGRQAAGEWASILDGLRTQSRLLYSDHGPGFFLATRHEEALEILQDPQTWSSRAVSVLDPDPAYLWIPEMLDPPEHTAWRRSLGPLFSPKTVDRLED
jgi:cytochrome P450